MGREGGASHLAVFPELPFSPWIAFTCEKSILVNTERSELDFLLKILMKFLWRENSTPTPSPIKLKINAENILESHCGIGRIRLLWRRYNLSWHVLLNLEEKPASDYLKSILSPQAAQRLLEQQMSSQWGRSVSNHSIRQFHQSDSLNKFEPRFNLKWHADNCSHFLVVLGFFSNFDMASFLMTYVQRVSLKGFHCNEINILIGDTK